jgi:SAM-dependent methyltransferase
MSEDLVWHEDDTFWVSLAPVMFQQDRVAAAVTEVDDALALLGVDPGASILDLCCGVGRHSLELARRGFFVTGVDRTATYLEQARRRAADEGLVAELIQDDMRGFCRIGAFDAVLMMNTSFGYFQDPAENRQVLLNACRSLRAGGALLIELMGKEVLARIFRERDWSEHDGTIQLQERKVVHDWSWMENRWILLREGERREFRVTHWIYSAVELKTLLTRCGFPSVQAYGDLEGSPYDHRANRLVMVALK